MRFSSILLVAVAVGAATFANAAPNRGVEAASNIEFAAREVKPVTNNVVRDVKSADKVNRRADDKTPELNRRDNWVWAEFTDDYGNNGDGYHDLYSTDDFYVPTDKTKIKIHASPNQYDSFYLDKAWDTDSYQYLYQPYDGQLIDFWLDGTWFKFEVAGDDDKKKKAH
ncbi:uncharacterized protein FA14DRAFT_152355 [Meira miltonrushii]|uniref:Uncharacterized protein n=1 Tax=Meira miltonrushii TaxID=1280837 RepID=A0A316VI51_9BASI|nr:uncharacterized protein FA14DRAFT_152355 [Meira miltonrushii]PWN36934.1 hypothetical protein FA14DRAFT_152355 [Meira miltonrushii]